MSARRPLALAATGLVTPILKQNQSARGLAEAIRADPDRPALLSYRHHLAQLSFLLDRNIADIAPATGIAIGAGSVVAAWLVYEILCRSPLIERPGLFAATRAELARIRVENERLKKARVRLVSDDAAVEEAGRAMGLIRDGEILVTIKQPSATPARPAR